MNRPEQSLHQSVVRYLNATHPGLIYFHPANGGARSAVEGAILKSMGVRAGVPDLVFVLPDGRASFIELKAGKTPLNPAQKQFRAECEFQRVPFAECRTLAEVEGTLAAWGVKARGRISA